MGFALWLVPSPAEYAVLEELMAFRPRKSTVKEGSKSYPYFQPHTTLATFPSLPPNFHITHLPIDGLSPPVMQYQSWKRGDNYLGALVVKLSKTDELRRLHSGITSYLDSLSVQWKSRNFPHMSLFYVDEAEERALLAEDLERCSRIRTSSTTGTLVLDPHPHTLPNPISRFTGAEVWLVDCRGSVREWTFMEKSKLGGDVENPRLRAPIEPSRHPHTGHRLRRDDDIGDPLPKSPVVPSHLQTERSGSQRDDDIEDNDIGNFPPQAPAEPNHPQTECTSPRDDDVDNNDIESPPQAPTELDYPQTTHRSRPGQLAPANSGHPQSKQKLRQGALAPAKSSHPQARHKSRRGLLARVMSSRSQAKDKSRSTVSQKQAPHRRSSSTSPVPLPPHEEAEVRPHPSQSAVVTQTPPPETCATLTHTRPEHKSQEGRTRKQKRRRHRSSPARRQHK